MFENLEVMRIAKGLASYAAALQGVVARNIANADTPEFRAQDIASFESTFRLDGASGPRAAPDISTSPHAATSPHRQRLRRGRSRPTETRCRSKPSWCDRPS